MADIERGLKAGAALALILSFVVQVVIVTRLHAFVYYGYYFKFLFFFLPFMLSLLLMSLVFTIFYDRIPTKSSLSKGVILFLIPALLYLIYKLIPWPFYSSSPFWIPFGTLETYLFTPLATISPINWLSSQVFPITDASFANVYLYASATRVLISAAFLIDFLVLGLLLGFLWDKFGTQPVGAEGFFKRYGWVMAALLSLVMMTAGSFYRPISNQSSQPQVIEKCNFPVELICTEHIVARTSITFVLLNVAGREMNIHRISASSDALGTSVNLGCGCYVVPANGDNILKSGATAAFILKTPDPGCLNWCNFRNTGSDYNKYNITVFYSWSDNPTVEHTLPGELLARKP